MDAHMVGSLIGRRWAMSEIAEIAEVEVEVEVEVEA
jgi:hypothetical protein